MLGVWLVLILLQNADITIAINTPACAEKPVTTVNSEGPSPAPICRFPYLVSLQHPMWLAHECAGTLIHPRYVITSATCAKIVVKGIANINGYYREGPFEEKIEVVSYVQHPKYNPARTAFNMAILILKKRSTQKFIQFAKKGNTPQKGILEQCSEQMFESDHVGSTVSLVGWGRVAPQGAFSDLMQSNDKLEVNPPSCSTHETEDGVICAGVPNTDLCEGHTFSLQIQPHYRIAVIGDMGGPLISKGNGSLQDILVGVTSRVVGNCATQKGPGLFSDVASASSWIKQITQTQD